MSNSFQVSHKAASTKKVHPSKGELPMRIKKDPMQDSEKSIPVEKEPKMSPFDADYTPLSGKLPYCHSLVTKSNLKPLYQMAFGARMRKHFPSQLGLASITCRGKTWEMKFLGATDSRKRLDCPSWRTFATENNLKVGDGLFWEVMGSNDKKVDFKLQIIKGRQLEEGNGAGETAENPISIE